MTLDCCLNWAEIGRATWPCIRPGGAFLTERALSACTLHASSPIADIGCGAGGTLEHLEKAGMRCYVGLDPSETLLGKAASRLGPGRLVSGQAEALPFKDAFFEALFCECVLSVLDDRHTALRESARVLKEGGFLILSDVFSTSGRPYGRMGANESAGPVRGPFMKDELLRVLAALGFSLLLWEEHKKQLGTFLARVILAGTYPAGMWPSVQGCEGGGTPGAGLSYFLLVAQKRNTNQTKA